ncbi:MAG TPA: hypothetical protein VJO33_04645 [Gemmatimonadaceae bacterium]|nr:hypothetical protein [Gemmatimonadaceae bacterium]
MPSAQRNSRAATLLAAVREEDGLSFERIALLIGVTIDELRSCHDGQTVLTPDAQAKLARTIRSRVPRLAARARRLEAQAAAAASFEGQATKRHLTGPVTWW